MKPTIVGVGVPKGIKIVAGKGDKRYIAFEVEHAVQNLQYPMRVKCMTSARDPDDEARKLEASRLIQYVGEAEAEGYESKQSGKILGVVRVWVKSWDALDYGHPKAPDGPASGERTSRPFKKPQATPAPEEDPVPF